MTNKISRKIFKKLIIEGEVTSTNPRLYIITWEQLKEIFKEKKC